MSKGELQFVSWIARQTEPASARVTVGVGDDMAGVQVGGGNVLVTSDMLLDGVHFECGKHTWEQIGRKAIACSLSDCAAMAARPVCATVSVALADAMTLHDAQNLFTGMQDMARRYGCRIVGGDTTSWPHRLAIDVSMLAEAALPRGPVLRSTAQPGDAIYVTGPLGGSSAGRHLLFEPRLDLLDALAGLADALHAMIDISDGLALDLFRVCQASALGADLEDKLLEQAIHQDAHDLAAQDDLPPLEHVLHDGEDFELLLALDAAAPVDPAIGFRVGRFTSGGMTRIGTDGRRTELTIRGYEHFR